MTCGKYLLDLSAASCLLGLRDELLDAVGELAHELVRLALLLGGRRQLLEVSLCVVLVVFVYLLGGGGREGVRVLRERQPLARLADPRLQVRQHPLAEPQELVGALLLPEI